MEKFEKDLKELLISELDRAENIWNEVKDEFVLEKAERFFSLNESKFPSKIPGFPFLKNGKPEVGDFIAFVLDIRNSTNHLLQRISEKTSKASQLERVLYETTAINTCGIEIIKKYNGGITEFLGDGFLALFKGENKSDVYPVHNAAKKCISVLTEIINPVLYERYQLPKLEIGIGLAHSKAIVTLIGTGNDIHPKAIGECIFRATKLSVGINEIISDERLKLFWPSEKGGKLHFNLFQHKNKEIVAGYKMTTE